MTDISQPTGSEVKPPAKQKRQAKEPPKTRKKPVRVVFGRILKAVEVSPAVMEDGKEIRPAVLKLHWFELKQDGLHVRRFRSARKTEKTWPFKHLANVAKTQMDLFP